MNVVALQCKIVMNYHERDIKWLNASASSNLYSFNGHIKFKSFFCCIVYSPFFGQNSSRSVFNMISQSKHRVLWQTKFCTKLK